MFLNNSKTNTQSQTFFGHTVRQGQDQEEGKKPSSLYTKLILWQHSKSLFKLLKWYTWPNSSKVATFPVIEPKYYLLVTLGKEKTEVKCMLKGLTQQHGLPLPYVTCTYSPQQRRRAPETAGWTNVPGQPTTTIIKASSSVARCYDHCNSEGFPRDRETNSATVLFCSVPSCTS